jgi:hypothetical protein
MKAFKFIVIPESGMPVEKLKGQLVSRKIGGKISKKVYEVKGYCRYNRAYQLDDCDDISRAIYVKKGYVLYEPIGYEI